jgi:hypothetical protein
MEIHADNSNEQIHAKNASNENKNNEQNADKSVIILNRACILLSAIYDLVHVFRPAFQSTQNKKTYHALENIVEIYIVGKPSAVYFGTIGDVDAVGRNGRVVAVAGVAREKVYE